MSVGYREQSTTLHAPCSIFYHAWFMCYLQQCYWNTSVLAIRLHRSVEEYIACSSKTVSDRPLKDSQPICNASLTGEDKPLSSKGKVSRRLQMLDVLDDIKCRKADIARHEKAVVALSYSFDGTLLATACESLQCIT